MNLENHSTMELFAISHYLMEMVQTLNFDHETAMSVYNEINKVQAQLDVKLGIEQ